MEPKTYIIQAPSLGECWVQVSQKILEQGHLARYDGQPIKELGRLTMTVESPEPQDEIIRKFGDPAWLDWMHENFFTQKEVAELGHAPSYAVRLFNYAHQGLDQIKWVSDRLRSNPESRSATLTTFMPLTDTSYIPCISLLDFWIPAQKLELIVYAHSLDFGKKAYGNLVELAQLQHTVASQLGCEVGPLVIYAKSVHIYEPEWAAMKQIIESRGVA